MQRTPKQELHELYQAYGLIEVLAAGFSTGAAPGFRITAPRFVCELRLPPLSTFRGQVVRGEGTNKKLAEHAAAVRGLDALLAAGIAVPGAPARPLRLDGVPAPQAADQAVISQDQIAELARQLAQLLPQGQAQPAPTLGIPEAAPSLQAGQPAPAAEPPANDCQPPEASGSPTISAQEVEAMSAAEAKQRLRQALAEAAQLRAALQEERGRKKFAAEALLGAGAGNARFRDYFRTA